AATDGDRARADEHDLAAARAGGRDLRRERGVAAPLGEQGAAADLQDDAARITERAPLGEGHRRSSRGGAARAASKRARYSSTTPAGPSARASSTASVSRSTGVRSSR